MTLVATSHSTTRKNLGYAGMFQMKITQVFRSSEDDRVISEGEIGGADATTPVPITGDKVHWIVRDQVYTGVVKSRLISYSAPDKIGLERSDDIDITISFIVCRTG
jgi:hypothetical protein